VVETIVSGIVVLAAGWLVGRTWRSWSEPRYATSLQDLPPGIDKDQVGWHLVNKRTSEPVLVGPLKRAEWRCRQGDEEFVLVRLSG
jgi:hypothetical protein